jgi:hypothetical protein
MADKNNGSFLSEAELFVDKIIPYLILVLFVIIILDVFFRDIANAYQTTIFVIDTAIVFIFLLDIIFKYRRVHNIPRFLRKYWLDVLAIFPFFLLMRMFEEFLLLSERSALTLRNLFHAGIVLEEEAIVGTEAAKTAELIAQEGRIATFSERLAFLRRVPRLFKAFSFYEHPKQKKTLYHKKK